MNIFIESIYIAIKSIKANILRSILTIMIIAIGIMALVGILTAIDSVKSSINENFTSMGAGTFNIKSANVRMTVSKDGEKNKIYQKILFREAEAFKNTFNQKSKVSVSSLLTRTASLKFKHQKTDPNITVWGSDYNYIFTSGYEIMEGRNFSKDEVGFARNVVLIGKEIKERLFANESPLGKDISVGSNKFKIIGVLNNKGSSIGFSGDRVMIVPLDMGRMFAGSSLSYIVSVLSEQPHLLDETIGKAIIAFRKIRKLQPSEENNFLIVKSDNLANMLIDNIRYVTIAATLIGFITLVGAAIGLMNIMLVSVAERTREIGTRKALGATSRLIRNQFLIESIVLCQIGGFLGIFLGILIGNITAIFMGGIFIIPWSWIFVAVSLCFIVGVGAGVAPALKASKLDPIIALRYE